MKSAHKTESLIKVAAIPEKVAETYLRRLNEDIEKGLFRAFDQIRTHTQRRTYSFGYDYFLMREGDYTYKPIPPYLRDLCCDCLQALSMNKKGSHEYENVIVSSYGPKDRLEPHIDVDFSNPQTDGYPVDFYFGEHVIGVILKADEYGCFYIVDAQEQVLEEMDEFAGRVFLLTGPARRDPYKHGVSSVHASRVSVTFRTVIKTKK